MDPHETCTSASKALTKQYFLLTIQPVLTYVLQFSTTDSFVNVIYDYMESSWDFTRFDITDAQAHSFAQLSLRSKSTIDIDSLLKHKPSSTENLIVPISQSSLPKISLN